MTKPWDCPACGEDGGAAEGYLGCKFNGCVHYVDALEKAFQFLQFYQKDDPQVVDAIKKVKEMGKNYGRPFDYGYKT